MERILSTAVLALDEINQFSANKYFNSPVNKDKKQFEDQRLCGMSLAYMYQELKPLYLEGIKRGFKGIQTELEKKSPDKAFSILDITDVMNVKKTRDSNNREVLSIGKAPMKGQTIITTLTKRGTLNNPTGRGIVYRAEAGIQNPTIGVTLNGTTSATVLKHSLLVGERRAICYDSVNGLIHFIDNRFTGKRAEVLQKVDNWYKQGCPGAPWNGKTDI